MFLFLILSHSQNMSITEHSVMLKKAKILTPNPRKNKHYGQFLHKLSKKTCRHTREIKKQTCTSYLMKCVYLIAE